MIRYAVDLTYGTLRYYGSKYSSPTPTNGYSSHGLNLTYTDSLLAIF